MDQNACAECGFSTGDLAEFTRHVERHENVNGQQKLGKERRKNERRKCQQIEMMAPADEDANANEFGLEQNLDEKNAENSAEMLGLADLSRFLSAAANSNCQTATAAGEEEEEDREEEEEQPNSGASLSPMSMSTNNHYSATEDNADGQEETAKMKQQKSKSCPSTSGGGGGNHHKNRRSGGNGGGGGKTTHRCPHCTFTTFMSQHMKSHLRAHENFVGQMYICDVCGMAFSQKANMHRHRGTHSGVKPYECRFCQKRFFRKDQMQEHSMTHIKTGDDFDCPVSGCDQTFSQHSLLRQHLDHKHQIASTLQAKCKRCTLQFSNSRRLLLHYQTKHDEYYCRVSPVPEGQSPVKRVLGHLKGAESSQNSQTDAEALSSKRRSRKRQRSSNNGPTNESSMAKTSKHLSTSTSSATICNYNVDELLKLECNGGHLSVSASVSPAIFDQIGAQQHNSATATPLFVEPSPSQYSNSPVAVAAAGGGGGAGFDLFREHLFRTCSSAALFSNSGTFLGGSAASKEQNNNNQNAATAAAMASAAAAQLFMQSLMFQQHHQPLKQSQIMPSNDITMTKNDERHSTPLEGSSGKKHLPMAISSPDCRGLILNGFKSSPNTPSKMAKREQQSIEEKPINLCSTHKVNNGINDDGDASESEGHLSMELDKNSSTIREDGTKHHMPMPNAEIELKLTNSSKSSSNRKIPGKETKKQASQSQQHPSIGNHPSGHNSTTHSPSSSSTASSSVDVGGGSATSSNDSPLKVLNGLSAGSSAGLLSRVMAASSEGLLKEALDQNEDMECTHCGLVFSDQTLYLLHKGLHSDADPWRCNLCGQQCNDKYTFTTHIVSSDHS